MTGTEGNETGGKMVAITGAGRERPMHITECDCPGGCCHCPKVSGLMGSGVWFSVAWSRSGRMSAAAS
jgi:hypothetical protein